ncbi:hypothetical protein [Streptomyces sp. MJP52]|uniref:hypothetical protein n=1 Tax=Streptomyces sp. MJP52 TaxID=2940555 RepID=UPI0024754526|nr:hypothetical protein [Streptomyces sp. MJP52]MDH6227844.1 hypothetical protein [Streptomyces sp. MJP52]
MPAGKRKSVKRVAAAEPRQIPEFREARSRPRRKPSDASGGRDQSPRPGSRDESGRPDVDRPQSGPSEETAHPVREGSLADLSADPEAMFRILSEKIAPKVAKAARSAGTHVTQTVSHELRSGLDDAIAEAMSAAAKMGSLVEQAVQSAVDEALRTAVLNATRVRAEHLAQLALIDRTARTTLDVSAIRLRLDAEMRRSSLTRVTVPDPDLFNLVNPAEHAGSTAYEVLAPAYVDDRTGTIVQRGEMRRVAEGTTEGQEKGDHR